MTSFSRITVISGIAVLCAVGAAGIVLASRGGSPGRPAPTTGSPSSETTPSISASVTASAAPRPSESPSPQPSTAPTSGTSAPPSPHPTSDRHAVNVVVTQSGWDAGSGAIEVAGYAVVIEPEATCTLTVTRGSLTRAATRQAASDASTTSCGVLSVPAAQLSAGTWTAVLTFDSASSVGVSAPLSIEVKQ